MRYASYVRKGQPSYGIIVDGGIVDLGMRNKSALPTLRALLTEGRNAEVSKFAAGRTPDYMVSEVTLLPVIPDPEKILCVGLNYESHRRETKRPDAQYPTIFTRFADTQVAHGHSIVKPFVSDAFDYEGELAVIIGRGGRHISEDKALEHVFGYSCYNDATARDWQRHTHQFTPGKNFPSTGAFGPWAVTADEVSSLENLTIETRVNSETVQSASLADLIFSVPRLIAYCSTFTALSAGDIILTGTPGGVGDRRDPPSYLRSGDVVEVEISQIGRLVNVVSEES